jgi:UDP-N-acetylglucosamine 2-epimerase (non-hydrolysing)
MTVHHEENTDYPERLAGVMEGARRASRVLGVPIMLPAHPRTVQRLAAFGLTPADAREIRMVEPLGYLDMLVLLGNALLALTDSGGVTQEAAILRVPCLTLNLVTEWREVVAAGANLICGTDPARIEAGAIEMSRHPHDWSDPFGEPGAGERVAEIVEREVLEGQFLPPRPQLPPEPVLQ